MKQDISLGCVIPFYNEGIRVLSVVEAITKINKISEIVCVNDGSTDNTQELIKEKYPQIKVVNLKNNQGKSEAVRKGAENIKSKYIFLIDADIANINTDTLNTAISKIECNPSIDMLIFDNKGNSIILDIMQKIIRANIIFSGTRILTTKTLLDVYDKFRPKKFQLELAIDRYMQEINKNIYWSEAIGENPVKMIKGNTLKGWKDQIEMDKEIFFGFMSLSKVLILSFTFCRDKIPDR